MTTRRSDPNLRALAIEVRRMRRDLGLTQREIEEPAGLGEGYFSRVETARRRPCWSTLAGIARAFCLAGAMEGEATLVRRFMDLAGPSRAPEPAHVSGRRRAARIEASPRGYGVTSWVTRPGAAHGSGDAKGKR